MGRYTGSSAYARTMGMRPVPFRRRPNIKRTTPSTGWKKGARLRLGMRVRRGALTRTKQKRRVFGNGKKTGENSSMSYCKMGKAWMSGYARFLYKKVQSRQVDCKHASGNASSTTGSQAVIFQSSLITSDLANLKSNINGVATDNNIRMFIGHVKRKYILRNQTNTVAKVSIYDLVYKRNPVAASFDSPVELWQKGYTDMGVATQHLEVGNTPFNAPEFRRYMYVKRVTVLNLEPGQQHEHTFIHRINRIVESSEFDNSLVTAIGGLTTTSMAVFHGSLGHESLTAANVSYMPITLDWATMTEVHYGFVVQNKPAYNYTNTVPKTITNFDFMGENQDADMDNIAA